MPHAEINGGELFYDETGSGRPILFHHGYTATHQRWDGVVERLQDRYRCIVMDCRGAGDSAHTENGYSIDQYARDVIGLADHLGLERFAYVGHSMGGAIGMLLGLEYADRLDRLMLVAPIPSGGVPATSEKHDFDRRLWEAKERDTWQLMRRTTSARIPNEEEFLADAESALSVSTGHYEQSWASMAAFDVTARLGELSTPTLVVAAAADGLLAANLQDFHRLGNATLHVFSRVSHGIPREVPGGLSRVLADFMEHDVVTARTLEADLRQALQAYQETAST
jgi:pimeloyl-ACP methyl ester carboxylesterase